MLYEATAHAHLELNEDHHVVDFLELHGIPGMSQLKDSLHDSVYWPWLIICLAGKVDACSHEDNWRVCLERVLAEVALKVQL